MKPGVTFINTARGAVVWEKELRRFLAGEPLRWQITKELAAKMT